MSRMRWRKDKIVNLICRQDILVGVVKLKAYQAHSDTTILLRGPLARLELYDFSNTEENKDKPASQDEVLQPGKFGEMNTMLKNNNLIHDGVTSTDMRHAEECGKPVIVWIYH